MRERGIQMLQSSQLNFNSQKSAGGIIMLLVKQKNEQEMNHHHDYN